MDNGRRRLLELVFGGMANQVAGAAARLRVPDAIGAGERSAAEVAADRDVPEHTMLRMLRAMAGLGLCTENSPGRFALTEAGALLRNDIPGSMNAFTRMFTDDAMLAGWAELEFSVRTGQTGFDRRFGMPFFDYLAERPELSALFNESMSQGTAAIAAALPGHYDFSRFGTVLDVGGGNGALLCAVLAAEPALRGILFDTAPGVAEAAETLATAGIRTGSRCRRATSSPAFRQAPTCT